MRTGKKTSKSYAKLIEHVPIWTYHILNNDEGYSIQRAYEINTLFGQLVERSVLVSKIDNDTIVMLRRTGYGIMAQALINLKKSQEEFDDKAVKYVKGKSDTSELAESMENLLGNLIYTTLQYGLNKDNMNEEENNKVYDELTDWHTIPINKDDMLKIVKDIKDYYDKRGK